MYTMRGDMCIRSRLTSVWSSGQVVKWSCGQVVVVNWSSGHVVKWLWSIETQFHYEH